MAKRPPIRTCIACGETSDKRELVRFVRTTEGEVVCDPSGRLAGRGAYVCRDRACLGKVLSKRMLDARLRCKLDAQVYARLKEQFEKLCGSPAQKQL